MVHGTMIPASPQAGAPLLRSSILKSLSKGATSGKAPSGDWASSTSTIHLVKNAETSILKQAVRTKTCASPIQPKRSSRCGQSVGTLKKLPRWPQTMLLCNWFTIGFEHSKDPLEGAAEWTTYPVIAFNVGSP